MEALWTIRKSVERFWTKVRFFSFLVDRVVSKKMQWVLLRELLVVLQHIQSWDHWQEIIILDQVVIMVQVMEVRSYQLYFHVLQNRFFLSSVDFRWRNLCQSWKYGWGCFWTVSLPTQWISVWSKILLWRIWQTILLYTRSKSSVLSSLTASVKWFILSNHTFKHCHSFFSSISNFIGEYYDLEDRTAHGTKTWSKMMCFISF